MTDWEKYDVSMGIFKAKYAKDDKETPEEFVDRVASIVNVTIRPQIRKYLADGTFCFGGRTLFVAGRKDEVKASSSNCYIMPMPEDDIEAIYKNTAEMARIFSRGGGAGVNISKLRPRGAKVRNSAETSTGAVSFLDLYNVTGDIIGARGRRAAEMVVLNCEHPDVEELVHIKEKRAKLASMNISILFTDEFMRAVRDHKPFTLHFHCKDTGEDIDKTIDAAKFFDEFCKVGWDMGDPGCLFNDAIQNHNYNSGNKDYKITTSNPCSEFLGPDYSSCNLGSINIYKFVKNAFEKDAYFDWNEFIDCVAIAVEALNDVLDYGYENQPLEQNKKCIDDWRQIGLGMFGLADAFVALRMKYGSKAANTFAERVAYVMQNTAINMSSYLAIEKKKKYGKFDPDIVTRSEVLANADSVAQKCVKAYGMYNGSLLSIAPTGSMSLFMGLFTGGIEPIFKLYYDRSTHKMENEGKSFRVYARSIADLLDHFKLPHDMSVKDIKKKFPWVVEAHDIPWKKRVDLQSLIQKHVDNAISSTVNLPNSATPEEIKDIYMYAWEKGCKGITVFRDGCARGNILGVEKEDKSVSDVVEAIKDKEVKEAVKKPAEETVKTPKHANDADYRVCPECGEKLFKVEGHCGYCLGCGASACVI